MRRREMRVATEGRVRVSSARCVQNREFMSEGTRSRAISRSTRAKRRSPGFSVGYGARFVSIRKTMQPKDCNCGGERREKLHKDCSQLPSQRNEYASRSAVR